MKRLGLCLTFVTLQACVLATNENESAIEMPFSADAYATCAACHLADGAGIPGAFPALRNRTAAMASLDGGQEYLITVAAFGLLGQIEVGGMQYSGVMPGNAGAMTAVEIAAALNYAIFELVDGGSTIATLHPITADDVAAVQSETASASPAVAAAMRRKLLLRHPDEWPE